MGRSAKISAVVEVFAIMNLDNVVAFMDIAVSIFPPTGCNLLV